MSGPNYAGNIIVNLASLPDFLRKPILRKRMAEFFSLAGPERREVIVNALEAGPSIPFHNFSRLFKTWLEVVAAFPEGQREELFAAYVDEAARSPETLIRFHLDGILGVFLTLGGEEQAVISRTVGRVVARLPEGRKRAVLLVVPDGARERLGL